MTLDHAALAAGALTGFVALSALILRKAHVFAEVDTRPRCEVRTSVGVCGRVGAHPVELGYGVRLVCSSCLRDGKAA